MLTLCREIVRNGQPWSTPWATYKKTLQGYLKDYEKLLLAGLPYVLPKTEAKKKKKKR
jgi:hypothetical protein